MRHMLSTYVTVISSGQDVVAFFQEQLEYSVKLDAEPHETREPNVRATKESALRILLSGRMGAFVTRLR